MYAFLNGVMMYVYNFLTKSDILVLGVLLQRLAEG